MAKKKALVERAAILPGVEVHVAGTTVTVHGPKGEHAKRFTNRGISIEKKEGMVSVGINTKSGKRGTRREKRQIGTYAAHITNMIKGVSAGHRYTLKVCAGHFPMNVSVSGGMLIVKNFLGEKIPRTVALRKAVQVKVEGNDVLIDGIDKEAVAQTAADIEQLCRISGRDKRVFQDGIFITNKDGKAMG
ncbi:MAG TPA: 50S ribosomal protein L6 [Candidatus Nanoarchaeia archaeon]|nr:50S ribosomal protein L6 [Candidatus Nanoarchaeia archaeon]